MAKMAKPTISAGYLVKGLKSDNPKARCLAKSVALGAVTGRVRVTIKEEKKEKEKK